MGQADQIISKTTHRHPFIEGMLMAIPILVGYTAVGIPFGILAVKAGLPVWSVPLMGLFVFAGSSQFVAIQLIVLGEGLWPIASAVFILNLRHFLMATSLGTILPRLKLGPLVYLAQSVTDETYGVNIGKISNDGDKIDPLSVFGTNIVAHLSWIIPTWLGAWVGSRIDVDMNYLAGALPVMFAVLLALQLKDRLHLLLALLAKPAIWNRTLVLQEYGLRCPGRDQ